MATILAIQNGFHVVKMYCHKSPDLLMPAHPEALPPYLVPPISVVNYLIDNDKNLFDGPLHAEIMDLGNGQRQVHFA